jgi:hypothetical protein
MAQMAFQIQLLVEAGAVAVRLPLALRRLVHQQQVLAVLAQQIQLLAHP